MIATAVAVMCHILVVPPTIAADPDCTNEEARTEEIVATSETMPEFDYFYCMVKSLELAADWKAKHPIYRSPYWRVGKIMCVPGHYEIRNRI